MRRSLSEDEALEMACKFIVNLPKEEKQEQRIWVHMQKAYFYYLDIICKEEEHRNDKKRSDEQLEIATLLNNFLKKPHPIQKLESILKFYREVPVSGVAVLNENSTKVLMVQDAYTGLFTFPKGKLNQGESNMACALRQLREETGIVVSLSPSAKLTNPKHPLHTFYIAYVHQSILDLQLVNRRLKADYKTNREIGKVIWADFERLSTINTTRMTKTFLQDLKVNKIRAELNPFLSFIQFNKKFISQ